MTHAGENEPVVHEPQAEPEIEPSWQHGEAGGHYEPEAWRTPEHVAEIEDAEPEMETLGPGRVARVSVALLQAGRGA